MKKAFKNVGENHQPTLSTPKNSEHKGMIKREILVRDLVIWKPKALVLCAGIGMTSEAIKLAGYDVIGVIDVSPDAESIYKANFFGVKYLRVSLREVSTEMICEYFNIRPGELALIQISNPCTSVSTLVQSSQFSEINDLFFVATTLALNIHELVGCPAIVYENVVGLTRSENEILLGMLNCYLRKYAPDHFVAARILNAYIHGDPQSRDRVFIQVIHKSLGEPTWPTPIDPSKRKHISDIIPEAKYIVSRNYGKRAYYPDEPAPTITGHPDIKIYLGDNQYRDMEPIEAAQFMGLSKDFKLFLAINKQLLGIGNGVCVQVMKRLAECIKYKLLGIEAPAELLAIETAKPEPEEVTLLEVPVTTDDVEPIDEVAEPHYDYCTSATPKIISAKQLMEMQFESLPFQEEWLEFLGEPAANFHAVVFGLPGHGKSTFAVQLASYLANTFGPTLYVSGEEGFSLTFRKKFEAVDINNIDVADLRNYEEIYNDVNLSHYKFLVIDSLNTMKIEVAQLRAIKEKFKDTGIITISQSTKDGNFRGSNEIVHDGDIAIQVHKGLATTIKNRYKETDITYNVFTN